MSKLVAHSKIMPRPVVWRDKDELDSVIDPVTFVLDVPAPTRKGLKSSRPKMTKDRKAANGMPCLIRLPGCTGGGPDTSLCHYRMAGTCGAGMKPHDEQGAWGCDHCHAIVDGRAKRPDGYTFEGVRLAHAEACFRTREAIREMTK